MIIFAIIFGTFLILCSQCICFFHNKCFRETTTKFCKCSLDGGPDCIIGCLIAIICCPFFCTHKILLCLRGRSKDEVEPEVTAKDEQKVGIGGITMIALTQNSSATMDNTTQNLTVETIHHPYIQQNQQMMP